MRDNDKNKIKEKVENKKVTAEVGQATDDSMQTIVAMVVDTAEQAEVNAIQGRTMLMLREEVEFIKLYQSLQPNQKKVVQDMIDAFAKTQEK